MHLNNKPWLNTSEKRKRAGSSIDVWKLFNSLNPLSSWLHYDSPSVTAWSEGHSLCPAADLYNYCVWDPFLWSLILIPCSGLLAEPFLKIGVCKPCEIHTTLTLQSELCSSASWVAQHMLGVLLSKDEAAGEWRERVIGVPLAPLLKDGSLTSPFQNLYLQNLLTFISYMVPAMVSFWTSMRWQSSLIQQKNETCKNTSQRVFCCTVGSGL